MDLQEGSKTQISEIVLIFVQKYLSPKTIWLYIRRL